MWLLKVPFFVFNTATGCLVRRGIKETAKKEKNKLKQNRIHH